MHSSIRLVFSSSRPQSSALMIRRPVPLDMPFVHGPPAMALAELASDSGRAEILPNGTGRRSTPLMERYSSVEFVNSEMAGHCRAERIGFGHNAAPYFDRSASMASTLRKFSGTMS